VITQSTPVQRVAAIRARLQAIAGGLAGIDQAEQQRQANVARVQPELDAALAAFREAEQQLEKARGAAGFGDSQGLGALVRRARLEDERDELEIELAGDLAPWAGQ
jgi:DNA repair exonuclease SbcCD ATPase subunit